MNSSSLSDRNKAIFLLVVSSLLWSLGGVFIKLVKINPIAISGLRSLISALFIMIVTRRFKMNFTKDQIIGSIFYAGTVILFVSATKLTTSANAIMLQYTAPIYVAFFSYGLLKERILPIDWISMIIVIFGMILFFIGKISYSGMVGNVLAILSGITFAGLAIYMRRQKDTSPIDSIIIGNIFTFIVCIPFIPWGGIDRNSVLGLLFLGTIQLGVPYILYSIAIRSITAFEAVLIPVLEPILNPVWTFLVLGEKPNFWAIIGGTIVILAVTLNQIYKIKNIKYSLDIGEDYEG